MSTLSERAVITPLNSSNAGSVKVYVASKPVDFRKGRDGLSALVMSQLQRDPFSGALFVFRAKRADQLKMIFWDGTGLVMVYKRLEEHSFAWPPITDGVITMNRAQFEALFAGMDWRKVRALSATPPKSVA